METLVVASVNLEVEGNDDPVTARIVSLICSRFAIRDITIPEAPLERIIESIYARKRR